MGWHVLAPSCFTPLLHTQGEHHETPRNRPRRPLHLETFEARQLLSASVAQTFTPHFAVGQPYGIHAADLGSVAISSDPLPNNMYATVSWDGAAPINAEVGGSFDGNFHVWADLPNKTLGAHSAHVEFWESPTADPDQHLDAASFDTTAIVDANSPDGTTIHATAGQQFSGYIGTLHGALTPQQIAQFNRDYTQSISVSWGDSHTSVVGGFATLITLDTSNPTPVPNNTDSITLVPNPDGGCDIYATHTYALPGTYHISLNGSYFDAPGGSGIQLMYITSGTFDTQSTAIVAPTTLQGKTNHPINGYLGTLPYFDNSDPTQIPTLLSEISVIWGDGAFGQATSLVANPNGGYDVYGQHAYAYAGSYNLSLNFNTAGTNYGVLQTNSIVNISDGNGDQLVSRTHTFDGVLGSTDNQRASLSYTVPPGYTPFGTNNVRVDWGDGSSSNVTVAANDQMGIDFLSKHTYSQDGSYTVHVDGIVFMNSYGTAPDFTQTLVVTDSGIILQDPTDSTPATLATINPHTFTGSFGDFPGDPTFEIDWGDGAGTGETLIDHYDTGNLTVYGSHTFAADGTYNVQLFQRGIGQDYLAQITVDSSEGPPTLHVLRVVDTQHIFTANFGPFSGDPTFAIDWGDAGTSDTDCVSNPDGTFNLFVDHVYLSDGTYSVTIDQPRTGQIYSGTMTVDSSKGPPTLETLQGTPPAPWDAETSPPIVTAPAPQPPTNPSPIDPSPIIMVPVATPISGSHPRRAPPAPTPPPPPNHPSPSPLPRSNSPPAKNSPAHSPSPPFPPAKSSPAINSPSIGATAPPPPPPAPPSARKTAPGPSRATTPLKRPAATPSPSNSSRPRRPLPPATPLPPPCCSKPSTSMASSPLPRPYASAAAAANPPLATNAKRLPKPGSRFHLQCPQTGGPHAAPTPSHSSFIISHSSFAPRGAPLSLRRHPPLPQLRHHRPPHHRPQGRHRKHPHPQIHRRSLRRRRQPPSRRHPPRHPPRLPRRRPSLRSRSRQTR